MQFLENKYTRWYYRIIYSATSRSENNIYTEKHHILPKSLQGTDLSENIVTLTAREHFICHILLTKMTKGIFKSKMIHAAIGMKRSRKYQHRYINARLYEHLKKEYAILARIRNTGKKMSDETRRKMSVASKGKAKSLEHGLNISRGLTGFKRGPMSENEKLKRSVAMQGRESPNKNNRYSLTTEQKAKISESNRKRVLSPETRAKIAAGVKRANDQRKYLQSSYVNSSHFVMSPA